MAKTKRIDARKLIATIKAIMARNNHRMRYVAIYCNISQPIIARILNNKGYRVNDSLDNTVTEKMYHALMTYVLDYGTQAEKNSCSNPKKVEVEFTNSTSYGTGEGRHPTERPGPAHFAINEMIVCGKDAESVRYYRSHEHFLNQPEICPTCLDWLMKVVNKQAKKTGQATIQVS